MRFGNTVLFKTVIRPVLCFGGMLGAYILISLCFSRELPQVDESFSPTPIAEIKKNFKTSINFKNPPRIQQDVDYSLGKKAPWWPKHQAPMLDELVEKGLLPPLEERMPSEPLVLKGIDGIGKYGGLWLRLSLSPGEGVLGARISYVSTMRWSPGGYPIVPHFAKKVDISKDYRTFTIHYRKGVRWSDGHEWSTDDVMFYFECIESLPKDQRFYPSTLTVRNKVAKVTKIDKYTVKVEFAHPKASFIEYLASCSTIFCGQPSHYLRKYHYILGDQELIKNAMNTYALTSPRAVYNFMNNVFNPECPRLFPWIYRSYSASVPFKYVRNPYYWAVDTAGNQLPYIDAIQVTDPPPKMLAVNAGNGMVSMQHRGIRFENFTELKNKALESGRMKIILWHPTRYEYVIYPNLNRLVYDKATEWKAKILKDKRFRQAFSLALDRDRMIRANYSGLIGKEQMAPEIPDHKLKYAFTDHDPARANKLLDEIGLTKRDSEGYRTFPDGTQARFYLDNCELTGNGPDDFLRQDLARVGIRLVPRTRSRGVYSRSLCSGDYDFLVEGGGAFVPIISEGLSISGFTARKWSQWYRYGGLYGVKKIGKVELAGPPEDSQMYQSCLLMEKMQALPHEKRLPYTKKLLDIAAENLWTITPYGAPPAPVVVDKDMHNVASGAVNNWDFQTPGNIAPETFYFSEDNISSGFAERLADSIVNPVLRPGDAELNAGKQNSSFNIVPLLCILIIVGLLTMLVIKYPFVLKRLFIMVPTLLIISMICFIVIDLPPGDYLSAEIVRLEQEGSEDAIVRIQELKDLFHFDEPLYKRYLRWMGAYWFMTFNSSDMGLLQGDMGRCMTNSKRVNTLIGERLAFTIILSLVTYIISTIVSFPIGIICAVRKGGWFDYGFMFVGFLAMCIPPFLLALILSVTFGTSGLFSPEFAAQLEWDWPKTLDFIRHLYPLIIITGLGMLAGGGRTFRANILDELHKPYVVTARAKGVRPLKLILKYPVRMAMNPWASSMGSVFPMLLSGNAMVAMVLGLPMISPLLLNALLNQDMYLAGSLLMLLSTLSVFGVLISDIMLIIVDPRIKYGKA